MVAPPDRMLADSVRRVIRYFAAWEGWSMQLADMTNADRLIYVDRRSLELADSGRCQSWQSTAAILKAEGFADASAYLGAAPVCEMLDARCEQAQWSSGKRVSGARSRALVAAVWAATLRPKISP